jgi:PST family polysaccharide transporter
MSQRRLGASAVVMGVCNGAKIVLQLGLSPALAHLLGPANYGLYSLAQPTIMFVMMLADAGLGQSLAREPEDNLLVWSSAFWLLLALGLALGVCVVLCSAPLSIISRQPSLPPVMAALSVSVILLTLTIAPSARLTRRGRIEVFALADLLANLLAGGLALGLAFSGAGVWALVGQMLALYGLRAIALNLCAFSTPRFVFSWRAVAPHTLLGGGIVAAKFADGLGRMLEAGIVGRRFGAAGLGMYAFTNQAAWSLVQGVANPTGTMLYAHAVSADDQSEVKALYLKLMRITALLTLPATAVIAALSWRLTGLILGPAWTTGAVLIAVVFPTQALGTLGQLVSAAIYARGWARSQFLLALANAGLRLAAVTTPFGGWSILPLYLGAANVLYGVLALLIARHQLKWRIWDVLALVWRPAAAAAIAAAGAYYVAAHTPKSILCLIIAAVAAAPIYLVALVLIDRRGVAEDWKGLRGSVFQRRRDPLPEAVR